MRAIASFKHHDHKGPLFSTEQQRNSQSLAELDLAICSFGDQDDVSTAVDHVITHTKNLFSN